MASKLWQWSKLEARGHIPPARQHAALACTDLHVWLFGGHSATGKLLNDVHAFDIETQHWKRHLCKNPPPPRARHVAISYQDNIIVYGGLLTPEDAPENPGFIYVLHTPTLKWEKKHAVGVLPAPRYDHAGELCHGKIYVYGGRRVKKGNGLDADMPVRNMWVLDAQTYQWTRHDSDDSWPSARYGCTLSHVGESDKLVMCGGRDAKKVFSDVWVFDTTNIQWMRIDAPSVYSPPARFGHQAAFFFSAHDSVLIVTGGETERGKLKGDVSCLDFDTKEWVKGKLSGVFKPTSRSGAASVVNRADRKMLLFGGLSGGNWKCDLLVLKEVSTGGSNYSEHEFLPRPQSADAIVQRELNRIAEAADKSKALSKSQTIRVGKPRLGTKANFEDAKINAIVAELTSEVESLKSQLAVKDTVIDGMKEKEKQLETENCKVKDLKLKLRRMEEERAKDQEQALEQRREVLELRAQAHNERAQAQQDKAKVKSDLARLKSERQGWKTIENNYDTSLARTQQLQTAYTEVAHYKEELEEKLEDLQQQVDKYQKQATQALSEVKTLQLLKQKMTKELQFEREQRAAVEARLQARDEADRITADTVSEVAAEDVPGIDPKGKKPMEKGDGKKGKKEDVEEEKTRLASKAKQEKKRRQNIEYSLREMEAQKISMESRSAQWQQQLSDMEVKMWEKDAIIADLRGQIKRFEDKSRMTQDKAKQEVETRKRLERTLRLHERAKAKEALGQSLPLDAAAASLDVSIAMQRPQTAFERTSDVSSHRSSTERGSARPATANPSGRQGSRRAPSAAVSRTGGASGGVGTGLTPRAGRPQSAHPSTRVRARPGRPVTATVRR